MTLPFVHRPPTSAEVERIRLLLSTFQDGTGMNDGGRRPGWRDFERCVAVALHGQSQESKYIFDVLLSEGAIQYGLSCKMGDQLDRINRTGRGFMELSNSAKKFWDYLATKGITPSNYKTLPSETGNSLLELVRQWHRQESHELGGTIDVAHSYYLTLAYNKAGWYQMHQFTLDFPPAEQLHWYFPQRAQGGQVIIGNLRADDDSGMLFEWYGESGGQLKYYPPIQQALWASIPFQLEPLPTQSEQGLMGKAKSYFPELWQAVSDE
ncbi:MAG: hypothetical protein BroJett018_39600 [Chloroflexota bacterium]|nr:MAG: hypothetical protein BroJett018_39600 [Chloroflexota bacterium]